MAEPVNESGNTPQAPQPAKKELSMEMRLLIAFILMGAVLFTTPYFYKSINPPPPKKTSVAEQAKTPDAGTPASTSTPAGDAATPIADAAPATPLPLGATEQKVLPDAVITTDQYRVRFSNHGASVRSWELSKRYLDAAGKPLELVNKAANVEYPFSLYFPAQKPAVNVNWVYFTEHFDADQLGVTYEYSDGHTAIRKSFRFEKTGFRVQVSTEASIDGKPVPHLLEWRGGFGDTTVAAAVAGQRTIHFNPADNKLVEETVKAAKNGPASAKGNFSFAGLNDTYFAAVFLPEAGVTTELVTFADSVPSPLEKTPVPMIGMAVGAPDTKVNRFSLFVGPKDLAVLKQVNPKLEQVVDFGWISILAKPLFLVVNWFNSGFVHNYGWAIVLVTIVINFVLFPLKLANMKSMRKMQALQPQIAAINDKYKGLGLRDPKKADQNQEVMDLYKKHGVNPAGGCVPMLLQIPFFFAFYKVFTVSVEMRGASWLWVMDLSQPETLPIKILPIAMIASQFIMQKMTPQAGGDPNQQRMMMFMPLIFGFMFYNFPSGLVLYYLTSNLVSMGQQWFFNHTSAAAEAVQSVQVTKKIGRK